MVDNPERKGFFGFFKFWKPSEIEEKVYKNVTYVYANEFAGPYLAPFTNHIQSYKTITDNYLDNITQLIKKDFNIRFKELDNIIQCKLTELKNNVKNKSVIERNISITQQKIKWLENKTKELQKILDI